MERSYIRSTVSALCRRILDEVEFYEQQAREKSDAACGGYLLYLARKKREQLTIVQRAMYRLCDKTESNEQPKSDCTIQPCTIAKTLKGYTLKKSYEFALRCAEKNLCFYGLNLKHVSDKRLRLILELALELERDFLFDVRAGFLNYAPRKSPAKQRSMWYSECAVAGTGN